MKIGVTKLQQWLQERRMRPSRFASIIKKSPSTITRILDGTNVPDIETVYLIWKHTEAAIQIEDWVTDQPKRKAK